MSPLIHPRVNAAREFLEIAKDFKDSKEIIREALSNSWDAGARNVEIKFSLVPVRGTRRRSIRVEITDDGEGMSTDPREAIGCSEIEGFFNLGDSHKQQGAIGSKGHGTKIYYKSEGITVDTWKNGKHIHARSETSPWDTLRDGEVPTFIYEERDDTSRRPGTKIRVDGFQAKQKDFKTLDPLLEYVHWYTVLGSFGSYFDDERAMNVKIEPATGYPVSVDFGFRFPEEQVDLNEGTDSICMVFGPDEISCGETEDGKPVNVQLVGALLGESHRHIVPDTYNQMGLWLCKDFIRIERDNKILEDIFGGQYYYRQWLLFANCQEFDLTANRNNIREDQIEYDSAIAGIKDYCRRIWDSEFVREYRAKKKNEDDKKKQEKQKRDEAERTARREKKRKQRMNSYNGRATFPFRDRLTGPPAKEPRTEGETALLLQAMISSEHPGVDFVVGEYNTHMGADLVIEGVDKHGDPWTRVAEIVFSLDRLTQWRHPVAGYDVVVCYKLGAAKEKFSLDGLDAKLVDTSIPGRYQLIVQQDALSVYVLEEILHGN